MIEILCGDHIESVRVDRPTDGAPRIHVGTQHGFNAILAAVGDQLTTAEIDACRRLWSDDAAVRNFQRVDGGTLFTLGDG